MSVYFEDAHSMAYTRDQKHLFYCFYNSTMNQDLPVLAHWHYYIEILYVTKGKGVLILSGISFYLEEGDMAYILPQDVHAIEGIGGIDFEYAVIKLDPVLLFDVPMDAFLFKNILPMTKPIPANLKVHPATQVTKTTSQSLLYVMDLFRDQPYGYEFVIKSKLMLFFYDLAWTLRHKGYDLLEMSHTAHHIGPIMPAFSYIHDHFKEPITAEDVAKHCHLSYSYFSRQFKQVSGITFTQYLNFTRVTEAEGLLLKQDQSITAIGYAVGFNDTSYFIRQFKSYKKITPKQFLKISTSPR